MTEYECNLCKFKGKTKAAMRAHVNEAHGEHLAPAGYATAPIPAKKSRLHLIVAALVMMVFIASAVLLYPWIDDSWANSFIATVNSYRSSQSEGSMVYCQSLSGFAQLRFNTMVQNYQTNEYGLDNDEANYFNGLNFSLAEDVLYPSGQGAQGYLDSVLVPNANSHPCLLGTSCFDQGYYGYYVSTGPSYLVAASCTSLPTSEGTYLPSFYAQNNCNATVTHTAWVVVEVADECPA